jgi:hypothetical protein
MRKELEALWALLQRYKLGFRRQPRKYRSERYLVRGESTANLLQCCILRHLKAECNFANQMID